MNSEIKLNQDEISQPPRAAIDKCGNRVNGSTDKIEVITVLEAVVQPHDPLSSTRGIDERRRLQDVSFCADMALLALAEHVSLSQLRYIILMNDVSFDESVEERGMLSQAYLFHSIELTR
jgi:hypothetical protein